MLILGRTTRASLPVGIYCQQLLLPSRCLSCLTLNVHIEVKQGAKLVTLNYKAGRGVVKRGFYSNQCSVKMDLENIDSGQLEINNQT